MQSVIVNAVAAGEVERVVVVSTEPADRRSLFGGRRDRERSAAAHAHRLPNWLDRREERGRHRFCRA
jgi:hypothetical protein